MNQYLCLVDATDTNLHSTVALPVTAVSHRVAAELTGLVLRDRGVPLSVICDELVVQVALITDRGAGPWQTDPPEKFTVRATGTGGMWATPLKEMIPGRDPLLVPKAELEQVVMRVINAVTQHKPETAFMEIRDSLDAFGLLPKESP